MGGGDRLVKERSPLQQGRDGTIVQVQRLKSLAVQVQPLDRNQADFFDTNILLDRQVV
jgi:hypothetical protein